MIGLFPTDLANWLEVVGVVGVGIGALISFGRIVQRIDSTHHTLRRGFEKNREDHQDIVQSVSDVKSRVAVVEKLLHEEEEKKIPPPPRRRRRSTRKPPRTKSR
jgi:hypothetical protein